MMVVIYPFFFGQQEMIYIYIYSCHWGGDCEERVEKGSRIRPMWPLNEAMVLQLSLKPWP